MFVKAGSDTPEPKALLCHLSAGWVWANGLWASRLIPLNPRVGVARPKKDQYPEAESPGRQERMECSGSVREQDRASHPRLTEAPESRHRFSATGSPTTALH